MQKYLILVAILVFSKLCSAAPGQAEPIKFNITLVANSQKEQQARQQLERVVAKYDLSKWIQTKTIRFDETTIPHSHPVLTLHTRHLDSDILFVSTFIHEQMHWWLGRHPAQTAAAISELKQIYPTLPTGYPEGADSLEASWEHLLVNWLELDAMHSLLGEAEATKVLKFWSGDHYTRLYQIIGKDREKIQEIMRKNGLLL